MVGREGGGGMWTLFKSPTGPLFTSGLGPLARYGTGVNHYQTQLNIFIKFVQIMCLLTINKVEGSLSKLLCMS